MKAVWGSIVSKEIVIIIFKSILSSILLIYPAFFLVYHFVIIVFFADINNTSNLNDFFGYLSANAIVVLICSFPILKHYKEIKKLSDKKKAKTIVIIYVVLVQIIYLNFMFL